MINIITFTPVWQRPEIFRICLEGLKRLQKYDKKRFQVRPFFMVSESAAARLVEQYGFDFIFVQNNPLGNKKNEGLKYVLQNYDFDYILELGSDDLITNNYLDYAESYLLEGHQQITANSVWFLDSRNKKVAFFETDKIIGLGRFISSNALHSMRVPLWDPNGSRGMDTFSWRNMMKYGIGLKTFKIYEPCLLDIKSSININSLEAFPANNTPVDELLKYFPEQKLISELL